MPYVLLRQDLNPGVWTVQGTPDLDMTAYRTGELIVEKPNTPIRLELNEESEIPSDFFESPYFIVSNSMKQALTEGGVDNIEYFEVIFHHPVTKKEYNGFWLGNVIGLISCVDETRSKFRGRGSRRILRQFEIDDNRTDKVPLFRLAESTRLVLISEQLKGKLQSAGLSGLYFQDTNKFNGNPVSSMWD